jgi:integrase
MPKRRGSGEGSIYHGKDGRWRGEISLGYTPEGKPLRKIIYGKDQAEVLREVARARGKKLTGRKVHQSKQTVADFLTGWLEDTVKLTNRAGTYRSYEWIVRVHLIPGLGKLTLEKLNPQVLQAFITGRSKSGLSPATVKHINATLRAALSQAEEWELIDRNVAKLVKLPRAQKYKPTFLSPDQAKAFLLFTAEHRQEAGKDQRKRSAARRSEERQSTTLVTASPGLRPGVSSTEGESAQSPGMVWRQLEANGLRFYYQRRNTDAARDGDTRI